MPYLNQIEIENQSSHHIKPQLHLNAVTDCNANKEVEKKKKANKNAPKNASKIIKINWKLTTLILMQSIVKGITKRCSIRFLISMKIIIK